MRKERFVEPNVGVLSTYFAKIPPRMEVKLENRGYLQQLSRSIRSKLLKLHSSCFRSLAEIMAGQEGSICMSCPLKGTGAGSVGPILAQEGDVKLGRNDWEGYLLAFAITWLYLVLTRYLPTVRYLQTCGACLAGKVRGRHCMYRHCDTFK